MPYKLKDAVRHKFDKKSYNRRDWKGYDHSLVNRGSLTIWFSEAAISNWNRDKQLPQKRGRPKTYSDLAIQTCHTLRLLYKQALRQTQGLVSSIIGLLGLDLSVPDHTTLSRRLQNLIIPKKPSSSRGPTVVIVDSSGLKVTGEKEWMNYKHGTRQRKVWRKLHIAINEQGEIIAHELTTHTTADSSVVEGLLRQIDTPIDTLMGDGGYDQPATYEAVKNHTNRQKQDPPQIVIPPNTGFQALQKDDPEQRKENQNSIDQQGRQKWQSQTNYGIRSRVENTFSRFKTIVGNKLKSLNPKAQKNEVHIAILILNKMHNIGMPKSQKMA
jgi:Transposase DDE domain